MIRIPIQAVWRFDSIFFFMRNIYTAITIGLPFYYCKPYFSQWKIKVSRGNEIEICSTIFENMSTIVWRVSRTVLLLLLTIVAHLLEFVMRLNVFDNNHNDDDDEELWFHWLTYFYRILPVISTIESDRYSVKNFSRPISHHKSIPFQSDEMFLLLQYPFALAVTEFRVLVICAYSPYKEQKIYRDKSTRKISSENLLFVKWNETFFPAINKKK